MKRIVIKIGSKVLTGKDHRLNKDIAERLIKQIVQIKKENNLEIIVVSSGAVSVGRSVKELDRAEIKTAAVKYDEAILKEQMLAAVGQPKLMAFYINEFEKYDLHCAQLLATRAVFADRQAYLSIRTVTESLLKLNIVPIFNENDVLSPEELDFSDNDQLASMVAAMLVADKLIILTSVDGLYDNFSKKSKNEVIEKIENAADFLKIVDDSKSLGKGGMKSKLLTADLITSLGISMQIANGFADRVIEKIIKGEKIGTFFPAKSKKVKALKNWLATAAVGEGRIYISTYLADIFKKKQTASVLFTGIEKIEGNFSKNEVVEICDDKGKILGRGISRYTSDELEKKIAWYLKKTDVEKRKIKAADIIAVHYDYFSFVI